jgi:hypothetical protein
MEETQGTEVSAQGMEIFDGMDRQFEWLVGNKGIITPRSLIGIRAPVTHYMIDLNDGHHEHQYAKFIVQVVKSVPVGRGNYRHYHVRIIQGTGEPSSHVAVPVGGADKTSDRLWLLKDTVLVRWFLDGDIVTRRGTWDRTTIVLDALRYLRTWSVPSYDPERERPATVIFMRQPDEPEVQGVPQQHGKAAAIYGVDPVQFRSFARPNDRRGDSQYMSQDTAGELSFRPETLFELYESPTPYGDVDLPTHVMGHIFHQSRGNKTFLRWVPLPDAVYQFLWALRHARFTVEGWRGFPQLVAELYDMPAMDSEPFLQLGEFLQGNDAPLLRTSWGLIFAALYGLELKK